MDTMTPADYLALSGNTKDTGMFSNYGGIILIFLFFLVFGWGKNGFGGNGGTEGLTLTNLERDTLNGQKEIARDILESSCATQKGVLESQYATLLGFKDQQMQMASCCCDLKSTIIQENQATRDAINELKIGELADKLGVARAQISNFEQSQYLLNTLGSWYSRPAVNPCTCFNSGCNNI